MKQAKGLFKRSLFFCIELPHLLHYVSLRRGIPAYFLIKIEKVRFKTPPHPDHFHSIVIMPVN